MIEIESPFATWSPYIPLTECEFNQLLYLYNADAACSYPLGMEDGTITDDQIRASSQYTTGHGPNNGRLDFRGGNERTGAWSALI